MSDDLKELKPCPFCGSEDVKLAAHPGAGIGYLHHSDTVYSIDCLGCTASFASRYKRELLVEQWNRRAPSADAKDSELLEALESLYNAVDSCIDLTPEVMHKARAAIDAAIQSQEVKS